MKKKNNNKKKTRKPIVSLEKFAHFLEKEYGLTELQQFTASGIFSHNLNSIFLAKDQEGNTRFIKTSKKADICANEYHRSLELWQQSPINFVRPITYRAEQPFAFVISDFCPSETLDKVMEKTEFSAEQKKVFINDLYQIYKALHQAHIVHRDVHPKNILVYNGHLVLIDCQLSVRSDDYKEISIFHDFETVLRYNKEHTPEEMLLWDDTENLLHILKTIGPVPGEEATYDAIFQEIKEAKGNNTVRYPLPSKEELLKRYRSCRIKKALRFMRPRLQVKFDIFANMYKYLLKTEYNVEV